MEIDRQSLAPEGELCIVHNFFIFIYFSSCYLLVHLDDSISIEEHDFVPHFQRVSISGEDTSGVPLEDLERASKLLIKSLELRERYMTMSHQSFPQTTGRFVRAHQEKDAHVVHHDDKKSIAGELKIIETNSTF